MIEIIVLCYGEKNDDFMVISSQKKKLTSCGIYSILILMKYKCKKLDSDDIFLKMFQCTYRKIILKFISIEIDWKCLCIGMTFYTHNDKRLVAILIVAFKGHDENL